MARPPAQARPNTPSQAARRPPRRFTFKVVGVSFVDAYPKNLWALDLAWKERAEIGSAEPMAAILIPNPDNEHDPNAVQVHVPALGDEAAMIGHMPRTLAERLSPLLLAGEDWQAGVEDVLITPGHEDRPGISIAVRHVVPDSSAPVRGMAPEDPAVRAAYEDATWD